MDETYTKAALTAESFMRSLAEQLAHQMGGKVEALQYFREPEEKAAKEPT
ncbi:hypothetical protein IMSAGC019_02361 [Lachnospiraceae bacterium]|nr:hypothetical protein IMSAGC019_02361 [Lachnospiraceae bacterium]